MKETLTVVAEVAVEDSRQHQGFVEQLVNARLVCLNAHNTILGERARAWEEPTIVKLNNSLGTPMPTVRQQPDALQNILDDDRLEHVQLSNILVNHLRRELPK